MQSKDQALLITSNPACEAGLKLATSGVSSGMRDARTATPRSMALRNLGTPRNIRFVTLTACARMLGSACKVKPAVTYCVQLL